MHVQRKAVIGPILTAVLPVVLFQWLRSDQAADITLKAPQGHFVFVTLVAALAMVVALAVGLAGHRLRNIKVSFMSLAYLSLAGVFLLHGLMTPGFVVHTGNLPAMFAQLSLLLTALWLCLSAASSDHWFIRALSKWRQWLIPVWLLLLGGLAWFTVRMPHDMDMMPLKSGPLKWAAVIVTCLACLWTMYRYWQSYRHAGFPLQQAIVYSVSFVLAAQYIIVEGTNWRLSWWIYHLLLLISLLVMVVGLLRQYFPKGPSARRCACCSNPIRAHGSRRARRRA